MMEPVANRLAVVALIAGLFVGLAPAGTLEAFEQDVARDKPSDQQSRRRRRSTRDDDNLLTRLGVDLAGGLIDGFVVAPGQASWARARGDANRLAEFDMGLEPREPGDPLLPLIRLDFAYFDIQSDVEATDFRLQGGYGPFAVELNPTFYEEQEPDDNLDLYRIWGLYRMSYSDRLEVDLGVGAVILEGNETNAGFSFTTPILVRPYDWLLLEFRPIWSDINGASLNEYEAGVLLNWASIALKAGYRWTRGPNMSLNGPFFGLSIRY